MPPIVSSRLPASADAITVPCFPPAMREALFDAVLVHDTIYPDATLPEPLRLPETADAFAGSFWLAHQVWLDGVDRIVLARLALAVARRRPLTATELVLFKHVRARCKQLRFAFVLLDARHRVPPRLDRITRAMGAMQDALKHRRPWKAAMRAALLRLHLGRAAFARLRREACDFMPADAASLRAYLAGERAALHEGLAQPAVTIRRFHAMRKTISRLVALFDCLRVLTPSPYHDETARFLGTVNGMMGGLHDRLVEQTMARRGDYARGTVTIPADLAARLRLLERALPPIECPVGEPPPRR